MNLFSIVKIALLITENFRNETMSFAKKRYIYLSFIYFIIFHPVIAG
jgi:hypothetical protein